MKLIRTLLFILLCTAATAGCEKFTLPDDVNGNSTSNGKNDGPEDDVEVVVTGHNYVTVAQAIEAEIGSEIIVKGYIVGSTERSMKNATYKPPFTAKAALILADRRLTETEGFYEDELLPIHIGEHSPYKRDLNLVDCPAYWNMEIYIFGIKGIYLGRPSITIVEKYEFVEDDPYIKLNY